MSTTRSSFGAAPAAAVLIVAGLGFATAPPAGAIPRVDPSVDLAPEMVYLTAQDVNEAGVVAATGTNTSGEGAVANAYTVDVDDPGELTSLGTLPGGFASWSSAINDAGLVVGQSNFDPQDPYSTIVRAFVWDPGTEAMTDLGTLGGTQSFAADINNDDVAVGAAHTSTPGQIHAYTYDVATGTMSDIGTGFPGSSWAQAINDAGTVVGVTGISEEAGEAFAHDLDTGVTTVLGTFGFEGVALADVNEAGLVLGTGSPTDGGPLQPFTYDLATEELHLLEPFDGNDTIAEALNDNGLAVASEDTGTFWNSRAVVYDLHDGTLTTIDSLIGGGAPGTAAGGLNDLGWVVGSSSWEDPVTIHAYATLAARGGTAPRNLTAVADCHAPILSWEHPTDRGYPTVGGYVVAVDGVDRGIVSGSLTSWQSDLPIEGTHTYVVYAGGDVRLSPGSNEVTVGEPAGCDPPPPPPPAVPQPVPANQTG
jgi:probable HAF family extracellular repeat protein